MKKLINKKIKNFYRSLPDLFTMRPSMDNKVIQSVRQAEQIKKNILVLGVVLADRKNHYLHITSTLSSCQHNVVQAWAVLNAEKELKSNKKITLHYYNDFVDRSKLINELYLSSISDRYDYIVIVDDDIRLPKYFLDYFIEMQCRYDFALAQPARTENSVISHEITRRKERVVARETNFVEIGPLVSVRHDIKDVIFPMDESFPMSWGLDYLWASKLVKQRKRLGIIDATPVAHTLRQTASSYSLEKTLALMNSKLEAYPDIDTSENFLVIEEFSILND